jgi:two-component system sensor histidine kinase DesK
VTVGRPVDPVDDGPPARVDGPADPPNTNGTRLTGSGGFGLAGIAERVASCGGSLTVGPGRAGGFAVTARLPTP